MTWCYRLRGWEGRRGRKEGGEGVATTVIAAATTTIATTTMTVAMTTIATTTIATTTDSDDVDGDDGRWCDDDGGGDNDGR
jgi:hypothetical protein